MYNLGELLEDFHGRHTKYQVDNFIIRLNGKTIYGQYKQILRELNSRVKTLVNIKLELDELNLAIDDKEIELREKYNELKQIELNRLNINKKFKEKDFDEIFYEFRIFFAQANEVKKELGDAYNKDKLESEFWDQNFIEKIAIDIAYMGTISSSNLETLTSMPATEKIFIFKKISEFHTKSEALKYLANLEYIEISYSLDDYKIDKDNFIEIIYDDVLKISG